MCLGQLARGVYSFVLALFKLTSCYAVAFFRLFVPPPMQPIDGESILVTGAVGGIGKEICRHVARSGSDIKLVLWDLNLTELEDFAKELEESGKEKNLQVYPFAVDISSRENIEKTCQKVRDAVGTVSVIVNNAGIGPHGNFLQISDSQIEKTFQVNLLSHIWIIRQFLPDMVTRNHGKIVNVCSVGGLMSAPHSFPYFSSKFGVKGCSDSLRMQLQMYNNDGVQVTTVYPYMVKTPIIGSVEYSKRSTVGFPMPMQFEVFMEPDYVGRKIVDGMRRGYAHIYLPGSIPLGLLLDLVTPRAFKEPFLVAFHKRFVFSNPEEQKLISTAFTDVVVGDNSNGGVAMPTELEKEP